MRRAWISLATGFYLSCSLPAGAADRAPSGGRAWTVQDSIGIRYLNEDTLSVSPDGSKFLFRSFRGDLTCDCNVFELYIFATEDVRRALSSGGKNTASVTPLRKVVRRTADHQGQEFVLATWEAGNESITFYGVNDKGLRQLFRLNAGSGAVAALTDFPFGIADAHRAGRTVIADSSVPRDMPVSISYPAQRLSQQVVADYVFSSRRVKTTRTFVSFDSGPAWIVEGSDPSWLLPPAFSANGHRAISVRTSQTIAGRWRQYDGLSRWTAGEVRSGADSVARYVLIDAEGGFSRPVFDAPAGMATQLGRERSSVIPAQALWAADGVHVVLTNTALPLTGERDGERTRMAYAVAYNTSDGQWSVLEPFESAEADVRSRRRISAIGWLKEGQELLIKHEKAGKPQPGTAYRLVGGQWKGRAVAADLALAQKTPEKPASLPQGLSVVLRQSANDPQVMVAADGAHEVALSDPDPALEGLWQARQEPFTWTSAAGETHTGGLLLPREPLTGPIPLVIQAYRYGPDVFMPDGHTLNGYAAQTLVARGMAVLNVTIPGEDTNKLGKLQELTDYAALIESATSALVRKGLVDPARVGVIGFSRAGYETFYAITHPGSVPPRAAVLDDAFPGTYGYGLTIAAMNGDAFSMYGGKFWDSKSTWLEYDPSFNADRMRTAALFTVHNSSSIPGTFDTIGALTLNQVPFDYWVFANGSHTLEMPRERLQSLELSVDWMSFWLQDREDAAPEKAERYLRWRDLRDLYARRENADK